MLCLVASFYIAIFNTVVLDKKDIPGGGTYYFPADGDVVTKDFLSEIATYLHEFGAIKSAEITQYTPEEIGKVTSSSWYNRQQRTKVLLLSGSPRHSWHSTFVSLDRGLAPSGGNLSIPPPISWKVSRRSCECIRARRNSSVQTGDCLEG